MNSAAVELRRYSGEVERHQHDYHQLILPRRGILEIEVGHNAGRVSGGIGCFVAAGRNHTFVARQTDDFIVIDVPIGAASVAMNDEAVPPFFAIGPDIRGLIDYLIAAAPKARLSPPLCGAWTTLLLERLPGPAVQPDRSQLAVRRAVAFMKRNLANPIRVDDIARAAGMSPTLLHSAFIRWRATTPHAELTALRLDAAEAMLADPGLSIAEIAIRSGYSDQSALTRAMRKTRETTPAEVRHALLGHSGGNG